MALADIFANVTTVINAMVTNITTGLTIITSSDILMAFVGIAFLGIALRYGIRLMHSAKKMA